MQLAFMFNIWTVSSVLSFKALIFILSLPPFVKNLNTEYIMRSILTGFLIVFSLNIAKAQSSGEGSPDIPGDLIVNIGFNFLQDEPDNMRLNFFGSKSLGLYYTNRVVINQKLSFYPAIGFGFEKYSLDRDVTLGRDTDNNVVFTDISGLGEIRKSTLAVNYLEVPLELRFYPTGTTDGSGLFVGIGASVGFKVESHGKVKFENAEGDVNINKNRENFELSNLRYGLIGRIGTRGINAFYRVYFSELFSNGSGPEDSAPSTFTFGIGFNAF